MMKIRKIILPLIVSAMMFNSTGMNVYATAGTEPLQVYFSDDGTSMKIFTSEPLQDNASILIGNETFDAEVRNSDVPIHTIFLIDNSTSMPYSLREEVKNAISSYVSVMPGTESVKIAMFDTQTTVLADNYSNDPEFINYELSKVDFNGQASLVYDAVVNITNQMDSNQDIYYRTVLITDGVDSIEGTSFDYMRSIISENSRYHIDVVQVSEGNQQDVNLTAIAKLGSNTYTLFNSGTKFDALIPETVSLMKVNLTNDVTTGEVKGITIKNGDSNLSLGSIMFPQAELAPTVTTFITEEPVMTTTRARETTKVTVTQEANRKKGNSKKSFLPVIWLSIGGVVILGAAAAVFFILRSKKSLQCKLTVQITKSDERDQNGVGVDTWGFPISSDFKVGRTLEPTSNDRTPLPKNQKAICENATNEDISSIGRNAFSLVYDKKTSTVIIRNIAKNAMFSVETSQKREDIRSGQATVLAAGSKILLGNYTTITIQNITVNRG
ncbi:MAG: vWA domain-containing protein [Ruminococcus sp.]